MYGHYIRKKGFVVSLNCKRVLQIESVNGVFSQFYASLCPSYARTIQGIIAILANDDIS